MYAEATILDPGQPQPSHRCRRIIGPKPPFKLHEIWDIRKSWTRLIGQSMDDDKCFLQDERNALERSDETEKTKPLT